MKIRRMRKEDYTEIYQLWTRSDGMGLRSLDDSVQGIEKFLKRNPNTNFIAVAHQKLSASSCADMTAAEATSITQQSTAAIAAKESASNW
ncbi:predicted amino-acid acetyltransferase [Sporolactobacillus inulinus]|uniref:Predicted amino-acid acetyltransferase n=1 Tax=Sporolactobacillus inulinus TaxID=2078 RepID=A0A4Y1ZF63_9BACL|nr:hypothetical protein [Sporolactobacillus inulinus]GAY77590.1 predicted amino-acid acetyltransferase [Sporolactobacillus inulinus]